MHYIVTLFWAFVLGQLVAYIGGALAGGTYNFPLSAIVSLVAGVIIILISHVMRPKETSSTNLKKPVT